MTEAHAAAHLSVESLKWAESCWPSIRMELKGQPYSIWIEAEVWAPGQWIPIDANSDAMVTFENGERWVATFFSYRNILSLAGKNVETGEYLGGKYLVATDMILVDEVSRQRIEEVVADLLESDGFRVHFTRALS